VLGTLGLDDALRAYGVQRTGREHAVDATRD
jgi:hypothetical protein